MPGTHLDLKNRAVGQTPCADGGEGRVVEISMKPSKIC